MTKKKIERDFKQPTPDEEETRFLILRVIEQAVKDYEFYRDKTKEEDRFIYETARDFIFDDSYMMQWGPDETDVITPEQLCEAAGIEIAYLRNKVAKKLSPKLQKDGTFVPDKRY